MTDLHIMISDLEDDMTRAESLTEALQDIGGSCHQVSARGVAAVADELSERQESLRQKWRTLFEASKAGRASS